MMTNLESGFGNHSVSPNLLIIGAMKSGTTSLYHYLKQHPDIFMSSPLKEPQYFLPLTMAKQKLYGTWGELTQAIDTKRDILEHYMLKGYDNEKIFAEATTNYTLGSIPARTDLPKRIYRTNPSMRFVYIIRNPFKRIVSNYLHIRQKNRTTESLSDFAGSQKYVLLTSMYYRQLKLYLDVFPRESFEVVVFEELISDVGKGMNKLFCFLDVENIHRDWNAIGVRNLSQNRATFNNSDLLFTERMYLKLYESIRRDVEDLYKFLGKELSVWDLSKQRWCA